MMIANRMDMPIMIIMVLVLALILVVVYRQAAARGQGRRIPECPPGCSRAGQDDRHRQPTTAHMAMDRAGAGVLKRSKT
jgi:hypothetical protein